VTPAGTPARFAAEATDTFPALELEPPLLQTAGGSGSRKLAACRSAPAGLHDGLACCCGAATVAPAPSFPQALVGLTLLKATFCFAGLEGPHAGADECFG